MTTDGEDVMKRQKLSALLGATLLAATIMVATPANAGTTGPISCGTGSVSGSTEARQITYETGALGYCGQLGIRVQYSSVAGLRWTAWTYSGSGRGYVQQNVGNSATMSQHYARVNALYFYSYR